VLNSIDTDGVKQGFDLEMLDALAAAGAGAHRRQRRRRAAGRISPPFSPIRASTPGLAASIFHTRQVDIRDLKTFLRARGVEMRL
jgi:cyclase